MDEWQKTYSETPNWLSNDDDIENPNLEEVTMARAPPPVDDITKLNEEKQQEGGRSSGCIKNFCLFGMSCLFIGFFTYVTIMEINDNKEAGTRRLEYEIFFGMSAALPLLFLCHWMIWFPEQLLYLLTTVMVGWGAVTLVITCLDFKDLEEGEGSKSRMVYEIASISASIYSSIYHLCFMKCFINKKKGKVTDDDA